MASADNLHKSINLAKKGEESPVKFISKHSNKFTQSFIRTAFREWLIGQHPSWASTTLNMHCSDAFYLYNNDIGLSFDDALIAPDGLEMARHVIKNHFTLNPRQKISPAMSASGYTRSLRMFKDFLVEKYPMLLNISDLSGITIPHPVIAALYENYAIGFRFDNTALRLLSSKAGVEVDESLQSALKRQMFHRDDDVYFLLDIVADAATRKEIVGFADVLLDEYGCFEISEFYTMYAGKLNQKCIGGAEDFERFYLQICSSDVRCVAAPYIWNRIARRRNNNVWGQFETIAKKIIAVANEEFGGVISENDLHLKFCAFSTDLLAKIIKHRAGNDILRVEINGIVCYQTLDALGLPDNFSDTLSDILNQFDDLGLTPNEEALHTAVSLALGVNFKEEYNIPDQETYRRLVAVHYKAAPPREWKCGVFREVVT